MISVGKNKKKWHNKEKKQRFHIEITKISKIMHTFTKKYMLKLLNLQGVCLYTIKEDKKNYYVHIGQPRAPSKCPHCKWPKYIKNGKARQRKIQHGILPCGRKLNIIWKSKRYKCKNCKKTWTKFPPEHLVKGRKRSTIQFRTQALRILQTNSFGNTQKQTGLSYYTIRETLHEFMSKKPLVKIPEKEKLIIGVDEHARGKKKLATTITLIKPQRKLLGLISEATSKKLKEWVYENMTYNQRKRVIEISMDMTKSLKKELKNLFPNANFVIDHFHVIAYLNNLIRNEYRFIANNFLTKKEKDRLPPRIKGLGVVRLLYRGSKAWNKQEQEKINTVFDLMPKVEELWHIKEYVRKTYKECLTKQDARKRWKEVLDVLTGVEKRTLILNLEGILNYFDNRTTNAFTEGCHTKVKLLKRISFGLRNPQVYVEKLSLGFVEPKNLILNHTY